MTRFSQRDFLMARDPAATFAAILARYAKRKMTMEADPDVR